MKKNTQDTRLMSRATDNGGEDSSWSIISSEPGLAHSGSVVNNESSNIIITHLEV